MNNILHHTKFKLLTQQNMLPCIPEAESSWNKYEYDATKL